MTDYVPSSVDIALGYILFVLHSIAISLHLLGIFLLSQQIKKDRSHQVPIMLNLSIAEIFMSVFDVAYNIMIVNGVDENISIYVYTVQCTCFVVSCFLILTLLTLDRFFEVYLNITYPVFFTRRVVYMCLLSCWLIGFSLGILLCSLRYAIGIDTLDVVFKVLFPGFEIIFFSSAVITYSYIYSKFRKLSRDPIRNASSSQSLKKRKFFVPTLIIFTFFWFAIIPDQLHLFLFYIYGIGSTTFLNAILLLYVIGFICDAVIYIFFQKTTYKILRKFLRRIFSPNIVDPENENSDKMARRNSHVNSTQLQPNFEAMATENNGSHQNFLQVPK